MKNTFTLLVFPLCLLFSNAALAQGFSISGTVKDNNGEALPFVNVSLLNGADSTRIQTTQTNEDGTYKLDNIVSGVYLVDIQLLGFDPVKQKQVVTTDITGLEIVLKANARELDGVLITGKRNRIETELGKTIVNISQEMKAGKNLLDLLKDVPGVVITATGDIAIEGKQGIVVLIDDKLVTLTGKALTEYLKGMMAQSVDKIELMTQPSAKYDAEGNSGIIAIKTNENKKQGWSGGIAHQYSQGRYPFSSLNGELNYRKDKLGLHLTPGGYYGVGFLIPNSERKSKDINTGEVTTTIRENGFLKERFYDASVELGADYDINRSTALSLSVKGVYHPNEELDSTFARIEDMRTGSVVNNIAINNRGFLRKNLQGNLFAKHEIDSNHKLTANGYYFNESKDIYQELTSTNYDAEGNVIPNPLLLNNNIPITSFIYSGKVDYTGKIGKEINIEAGVKTSYVTVDDANEFERFNNGTWEPDANISNHFLYDEQISAAYISSSAKKGKWQAQAGVRVEHTDAKGHELTQDKKFERNYTSIFPTAFVNYKVDDKNTIECNYGKRLRRPYYRELNPFTSFTSQYNYSTGNPLLQPMYTHNAELKHNYRGRLITTISYSNVNGVFTREISFNRVTNVSHYSTTNNGRKRHVGLTGYYNRQLFDWWGVTLNGNVYYQEYEGQYNGDPIYGSNVGVFMKADTQFTFKDGWYANYNVWYFSPYRSSAVGSAGSSIMMTATVSKTVLHDTGTIRLTASDPFGIYRNEERFDLPDVSSVSSPIYSTQGVAVAFSYNFGKDERRRNSVAEESKRM